MRILWIVNTIFPYPAEKLGISKTALGGWLNGLADKLKEHEQLNFAIATVYNGKEILEYNDGKIQYYLIPGAPALKYNNKLEIYWKEVKERFNPDLVHIHGTEYAHGLAFMNANPDVKSVVSIQGLVSKIEKVYYANMAMGDIIKNITLRDVIKNDNLIQQKNKFAQRGKNEIEIIKKADAIIGRTTWDYSNCKEINSNIIYYKANEIIREEFYETEKWNINKIERHSIYLSQGSYPIKGLHILLSAIRQLKEEKYNDIKLYVSGSNFVKYDTIKEKLKISGYGIYIRKMIKKYRLENNVIFTGDLTVTEVIKMLQTVNVVVLTSIIENESNSISEASMLGVPVVCSYVGGIVDRIENEVNGLLYPFTEEAMLANNIKKIFDDDILANKISKNSIKKYQEILNREKNVQAIIEIYKELKNSMI